MTPEQIAKKYVHGLHDALTDSQEKKDMVEDINQCIKESQKDLLEALQDIVQELKNLKENDLHNNTVQYYFQSNIRRAEEAIEKALK